MYVVVNITCFISKNFRTNKCYRLQCNFQNNIKLTEEFMRLQSHRRFCLELNALTRKMIGLAVQMQLKIENTIFFCVQRCNQNAHQFVEHFHTHRMKQRLLFLVKFLLSMCEAVKVEEKKTTRMKNGN